MRDLYNESYEMIEKVIVLNISDLTPGYISPSGSYISNSTAYKYSDKIYCKQGDILKITDINSNILVTYTIAPYKNNILIDNIGVNVTSYTVTDDIDYVIMSFGNSRIENLNQILITRKTMHNAIKPDESLSKSGKVPDSKIVGDTLKLAVQSIKYNYYDKENVIVKTNGGVWQRCPDIYVKGGQIWSILNSDLSPFASGVYITFYYNDNTTSTTSKYNHIIIPENVFKMSIICSNTSDIALDLLISRDDLINTINKFYNHDVLTFDTDKYKIPEPVAMEYCRHKPYYGKRILSLGDSYTCQNYYGKYLAKTTGTTQRGRGQNGNMLRSFCNDSYNPVTGGTVSETFNAELLSNYDIVTIMGGTNDYGHGSTTLGTINDDMSANTIYGSVKYLINKILSIKPDMKIFFCTQPFRLHYSTEPAPGGYDVNSNGLTMENIANAICDCCSHYGIPCFDFYHCSNWNPYTIRRDENDNLISNIYTNDGLHPKNGDGNGADLLGTSFGEFINQHII